MKCPRDVNMYSTNASVVCIKMEVKRMPRSKFLKLTCQDFWKPMEIEKKVSENKCNTKKINIFK